MIVGSFFLHGSNKVVLVKASWSSAVGPARLPNMFHHDLPAAHTGWWFATAVPKPKFDMNTVRQLVQCRLGRDLAGIVVSYCFPKFVSDFTHPPEMLCFAYFFVPFIFHRIGWPRIGWQVDSRLRHLTPLQLMDTHLKIMRKKWKQALRKWTAVPSPFCTFNGVSYTLYRFTIDVLAQWLPEVPCRFQKHFTQRQFVNSFAWVRPDLRLCLDVCQRNNLPLVRIISVHRALHTLSIGIDRRQRNPKSSGILTKTRARPVCCAM